MGYTKTAQTDRNCTSSTNFRRKQVGRNSVAQSLQAGQKFYKTLGSELWAELFKPKVSTKMAQLSKTLGGKL